MTERVAFCGLTCEACPIHLATREENKEEQARMRAEIVQLSREQYGLTFSLAEITDCDGCREEAKRLFSACVNCPIRKCAREKGLENCAYCADYTCAHLEQFLKSEPACRERLDTIRKNLPQEGK